MISAKRWLPLLAWAAALPAWAQEDATDAAERAAVEDINPAVDTSSSRSAPDEPERTAPDSSAARARAIDTLNLGTTSITGNQELPRVLYIVPWKQSDLGDLVGRPVDTLLDEVLAPIDPEVFERHVNYYETLYGDSQEDSSQ